MFRRTLLAAASIALFATARAHAADDILIGAVYPLSGSAAAIGHDAQMALETEANIINGNANVPSMLLGAGGGLPNLGGAHVKLVFADSQNNPQIARTEAERLVTEQHVVAIIGSYTSSTAVTISQICERYQIPYISAENSSPSLSRQNLAWFFRPSPTDIEFTGSMFDFIEGAGKNGHPIKSIAIIHENSVFGTDSGKLQAADAEKAGIKVASDLAYQASTPSLSVEAQRLKAADADLVLPSSYTSDAILPSGRNAERPSGKLQGPQSCPFGARDARASVGNVCGLPRSPPDDGRLTPRLSEPARPSLSGRGPDHLGRNARAHLGIRPMPGRRSSERDGLVSRRNGGRGSEESVTSARISGRSI